jgi:RNA recognition motif-containing protein
MLRHTKEFYMQSNKTRSYSKPNTGKPFNAKKPTTSKPASNKSATNDEGEFLERKVGYYQQDDTVTTLYVGNLSYKKDEYQIKAMLEKFGKVKYVKIVVDPKTSVSKGIAFVQMPNGKHAKLAIDALNDNLIDGRTLKVSIAKQRANPMAADKITKMPEETKTGIESEEIVRKRTSRRRPRGLKVLFDHLKK